MATATRDLQRPHVLPIVGSPALLPPLSLPPPRWANQFRVILSAAAYVLMETIRRIGRHGTERARTQVGTIRLKLLKIGTVIVRNTRRIRFLFASAYPYQELFKRACGALSSG